MLQGRGVRNSDASEAKQPPDALQCHKTSDGGQRAACQNGKAKQKPSGKDGGYKLNKKPEEYKIGEIISREKIFNYEIEYNNDTTLIGYDDKKGKKFILYPEAADKDGSDN